MSNPVYLAVDLGAGSGRVMAGYVEGGVLQMEECARFENPPVALPSGLHWPIGGLLHQVRVGLGAAVAKFGPRVRSLGIDTWGVDYGLLSASGELLGLPHAYRDPRTDGMIAAVHAQVPPEVLFSRSGVQSLFFNTLYQLYAAHRAGDASLKVADRLLFTPDLLNFLLTGQRRTERTIASTSQLYNPSTGTWDHETMAALGLPAHLFGPFTEAGQQVGTTQVAGQGLAVVAVASHDTASAVVGAPLATARTGYLSSGTWSLLGVESPQPILSPEALAAGYTNEVGYGPCIRFQKNLTGLWLVQECKRAWDAEAGQEVSYEALVREAEAAPPLVAVVDADAPAFVAPGGMPARLAAWLRESGQPVPATRGGLMRVILESLALKYRLAVANLEGIVGYRLDGLHIVGGGSKNTLLNQFTADALDRPVSAGPAEATALGNLAVQMIADGTLADLAAARDLIRRSYAVKQFTPKETTPWPAAATRLAAVMSR